MLSKAATNMARGELCQMNAVGSLDLAEARYYEVIDAKTADLFAVACRMAGTVARSCDTGEVALEMFGRNIGLAFQLVDDAIDYSSDSEAMGKAAGDDFRERKITLPVILSYREGGREVRLFWEGIIARETAADDVSLAKALHYMEESGTINATLEHARNHARLAKQAIKDFDDSEIKAALLEAADFAVMRSF
jgi:octaprenyl-diphosphate synthase